MSELTPQARARDAAPEGTSTLLGEHEWILSAHVPRLTPVWDRIYDGNTIYRKYNHDDIRHAAFVLLRVNYDLTLEETASLIWLARDTQALVPAVEAALFGPTRMAHVTYTEWAEASLWVNGIDPDKIDPKRRRFVLEILVRCGRTLPESEFISSANAAARRSKLLNFGKDGR